MAGLEEVRGGVGGKCLTEEGGSGATCDDGTGRLSARSQHGPQARAECDWASEFLTGRLVGGTRS